jgi:hypothetical protein
VRDEDVLVVEMNTIGEIVGTLKQSFGEHRDGGFQQNG